MSPNHSKIYDEYTIDSNKQDTYSFTIHTKIESTLITIFENNPHSIILTGNAGDGKTRLCRIVHDYFSSNSLTEWPENGIVDVPFSAGTIRIVKDLSELQEAVIANELTHLQTYIQTKHNERIYYLIAANEGKLTKFLSQNINLSYLREEVATRFNNYESNDFNFSIFNLLDVTSSVYVERVLEEWNQKRNWEACNDCPLKNRCIINMNHERTSENYIKEKIVQQYRLLDFLDTHITMREMLIHISYTLTGGYTCSDIFDANYKELEEQTKKPYYENFYGHQLDENAFSEMKALKIFKSLDPGLYSHSSIDDFIVNGDINGDEQSETHHKKLIGTSLDLQLGYFKKKLSLYRDYDLQKDHKIIDEWIPKLRRKYFYEIDNGLEVNSNQLLPFEYINEYISLFNNKKEQTYIKKEIINGFNRVFSGRLTEQTNKSLYATNRNLMIYDQFKSRDIEIEEESSREDIDRITSRFKLIVDRKVSININLAVFEFLMRISGGGTHNVLQQEAEILIDTFKNELIRISEPEEYELNILRYDNKKGLFIEDEISLL